MIYYMIKKIESYLGKDLSYKTVKGLDIAYLAVIQFVFAIFINVGLDKFLLPQQPKTSRPCSGFLLFNES